MRRSLVLCVFLAFLLFGVGCGRGSFVGKRLDNFSAYYNTFYNAEKALEEGVKAVSTGQEQQPIDQDRYLSIFDQSDRAATQRKPFEDAIKKSADILRKHPDSKWVDDALMVIGQAWFFTQNYVGAEQKFNEVITLDSRLHDEARFWLARTFIASGQFDAAFDHLQESLNREDVSRRWEPKLRLALAELHVQRENWEDAAVELETGLDALRDKELGGRAQFLLGQVYETLKRYDEAVEAYDRVQDYNPFYELSYAAQYSAVRVEGEYGDPDAALKRLRRMERDDKNYEHRGELAYLRGRILQAAGYEDDALDVYYDLLYDPDGAPSEVRGRTYYALGAFHRDVYEDYPYAAAYFDTARTSLQRPVGRGGAGGAGTTQQAFAPAAIIDGEEQAETFLGFSTVMDRIALMDSLLYLGSLDDSTYQEVILELRRQRAIELEAQRREMERLQAERQFQRAGANFNTGPGGLPPGKVIDIDPDNNAGFLFHRDPVRVQEGRAGFMQEWGDRPLVPNWRRLEAANAAAEAGEGGEGTLLTEDTTLPGADLPEIDDSNVPRDSLSQLQMVAERAVARYELANVLFLSMNRPDSAAAWYRMVIEEDGEEPVAQRAYYALAEVQRALGDTLASERLYRAILDRYPASDFSERARERLGIDPDDGVLSDTLALAEEAYGAAYTAWEAQRYAQSLNDLVTLAMAYPQTEVAPRALLAAGSVYMEWADRDSLDLFGALPLAMPDSVLRANNLFKPTAPSAPDGFMASPAVPQQGATPATPGEVIKERTDDTPAQQPADDTPPKHTSDDTPPKQVDTGTPVKELDLLPEEAAELAQAADTLGLGTDSLAVAPDVLADSLALPSDSLAVPVDSLAAADSMAVPEPEPVRLQTLYDALVTHYPESPQAPQARRVLGALQERQTYLQAVADSLAADSLAALDALALAADTLAAGDSLAVAGDSLMVAADSLAADSLAQAPQKPAQPQLRPEDVLRASEEQEDRRAAPPDSVETLLDRRERMEQAALDRRKRLEEGPPPAPADSLGEAAARPPGLGKIDWSQGGWTILVQTEDNQEAAEAFARNFGNYVHHMGYAVDVFTALVREEVQYRVGVGLFANELEAGEALLRLKEQLPASAHVIRIPKAP